MYQRGLSVLTPSPGLCATLAAGPCTIAATKESAKSVIAVAKGRLVMILGGVVRSGRSNLRGEGGQWPWRWQVEGGGDGGGSGRRLRVAAVCHMWGLGNRHFGPTPRRR